MRRDGEKGQSFIRRMEGHVIAVAIPPPAFLLPSPGRKVLLISGVYSMLIKQHISFPVLFLVLKVDE